MKRTMKPIKRRDGLGWCIGWSDERLIDCMSQAIKEAGYQTTPFFQQDGLSGIDVVQCPTLAKAKKLISRASEIFYEKNIA